MINRGYKQREVFKKDYDFHGKSNFRSIKDLNGNYRRKWKLILSKMVLQQYVDNQDAVLTLKRKQ